MILAPKKDFFKNCRVKKYFLPKNKFMDQKFTFWPQKIFLGAVIFFSRRFFCPEIKKPFFAPKIFLRSKKNVCRGKKRPFFTKILVRHPRSGDYTKNFTAKTKKPDFCTFDFGWCGGVLTKFNLRFFVYRANFF